MTTDNFDDDYGISAALADAGVPVVEAPQQSQQPQPQADTPEDQGVFVGEDVSAYQTDAAPAPQPQQPEAPAAANATISPEAAALLQQNQALLQQAFADRQRGNEDRIAELERRLAEYEPASKTQVAEPQKPWYEMVDLPELTEEQQRQYAASMPVIEAIARRQAIEIAKQMEAARINPLMQQFQETVRPLQETVNHHNAALQATTRQTFQQSLNARLPWLQEAAKTPAYAEYYNAVLPGTGGLTRSVLLQQAETAGNIDAIVDLLSGFNPTPAQPQQMVAPGRSHTIPPTQQTTTAQSNAKRGMKLSTYDNALKAYANGQMTPAKFQEYENAWNTALLNGTAVLDE